MNSSTFGWVGTIAAGIALQTFRAASIAARLRPSKLADA